MGRTRTTARPTCTLPDGTPIPPPQPDDRLMRFAAIDEAVRDSAWRARRRADLRRGTVECAILLGIAVWMIAGGGRPVTIAWTLLLVGPGVGVAVHALDGDRYRTGALGALGYALCMPAAYGYGAMGWLVLGLPMTFILFTMYGIRRESRAAFGTE